MQHKSFFIFGLELIGQVDRMPVSGYRGRRFEPRQHQYVVSMSKTLHQHFISWHFDSALRPSAEIALKYHAFCRNTVLFIAMFCSILLRFCHFIFFSYVISYSKKR